MLHAEKKGEYVKSNQMFRTRIMVRQKIIRINGIVKIYKKN
jgi:hypothetical protein